MLFVSRGASVPGAAAADATRMSGRGKSRRSLDLIAAATAILEEIQPATVRAVCYRLFTLSLIGDMSKASTNKVSTQLTWAREHGQIPWTWIVDETRDAERVSAWENPAAFVEAVKRSYRRDRWTDQPAWIEVWSEKGTIRGTLAPVFNEFGITFRVMHGYGSSTAIHQAAIESAASEKPLTVLYVGDCDPSGLHMRYIDLPTRLNEYGGNVDIIPLALTKNDTRYSANLPYFDAVTKAKDPRYRWYVERFGPHCWELDALNPVVLRERVSQSIHARIDIDAWNRAATAEIAETESLTAILNTWPGISGQASKYSEGRP
jgi:hypothetical protein